MEAATGISAVHSTVDLTGDGVADVLLVSTTPGASTQTETVRVFAWSGEAPRRVFDVPVVLGAGPAGWEVREGASPAEIETMCPALGHFDAPLLPHPGLRRTYAWDGQFFEEVGRRLDGPVSPHDQINRAEAAFWAGRYEEAAAGVSGRDRESCRRRECDGVSAGLGGAGVPAAGADWAGGRGGLQSGVAAGGNRAGRRDWADCRCDARGRGDTGPDADVCGVAAGGPDGQAAARRGGSIGFPMDAGLVLALGKALEIGLRGVGGGELSEAAITSRLSAGGVEVRRATVGDLNSDGALEAVVSLVRHSTRVVGPPVNDFWFVFRHGTRWVAQPLEPVSDSAFPIAVKSVSEGRAVITITDSSTGIADYLSFDGRRAVVWDELPTLEDFYPVNPFDGREIRRCEVGA